MHVGLPEKKGLEGKPIPLRPLVCTHRHQSKHHRVNVSQLGRLCTVSALEDFKLLISLKFSEAVSVGSAVDESALVHEKKSQFTR